MNANSESDRDHATASCVPIIVMGVSGCGKTTLAMAIAKSLAARFVDADDVHPPENVEKMRGGVPLTDADREPWLLQLNAMLREAAARGERIVLACSALKLRYRETLALGGVQPRWVFLDGDFETIAARLRVRSATTAHFMPERLLRSQFDALERPSNAVVLDVALESNAQLECALTALGQRAH